LSEGKNNWIPKIKQIIEKRMFVYAVPQTLYGRLDAFVYSPGRKLNEIGVNFLEDMLPETALVKLGWVLAHKSWRGSVATKKKMFENIAKEFNNKLGNEFLV
jgi:glutamyl-tRNA(Gln) amidotransferase subunit D